MGGEAKIRKYQKVFLPVNPFSQIHEYPSFPFTQIPEF